MAKTKTPTEAPALDAETQEKVAALTSQLEAEKAKADALEAVIEANLEPLFRAKYVLSLIPDKKSAAIAANDAYIQLRDAIGEKGVALDRKFRGV